MAWCRLLEESDDTEYGVLVPSTRHLCQNPMWTAIEINVEIPNQYAGHWAKLALVSAVKMFTAGNSNQENS